MGSIQFGASLAKALFSEVGAAGLTTLRIGFSALILWLLIRPWQYKLPQGQLKSIALYGGSLGLMNLTFYFSLERIPLGVAVALEFIGPLGVAIFTSRNRKQFFFVILAALGIFLLSPVNPLNNNLDPLGVLWALIAGLFWALYIVFGQRAGKDLPSSITTSWGMLFSFLVVLLPGFILNGDRILNPNFWPMGIAIALLSSAIPYSLEMKVLKMLPKNTFGVLMSLEPAVASLMGFLFLKEVLDLNHIVAIIMIITASVGISLTSRTSQS